jgi:CubicO group peptidase (beta-lactamase class C family)
VGRDLSALDEALTAIDHWGAGVAAAVAVDASGVVAAHGDTGRLLPVASVTKLVTAWAVLVAVEEGALLLDEPAGPPGSTVEHLLCHAAGYDFDTRQVVAPPGTRRTYSNTDYEVLAEHLTARTGIDASTYLREAVIDPLGMTATELRGGPAAGLWSTAEDLARLAGELLTPTLLHPGTVADAVRPHFPELAGVLPGWGRQDPNPWGLGPELRGTKSPHWTGATAPPSTFGHFGGSGSLLWVDPERSIACVALCDRPFDDWAVTAWPTFSDAVRAAAAGIT